MITCIAPQKAHRLKILTCIVLLLAGCGPFSGSSGSSVNSGAVDTSEGTATVTVNNQSVTSPIVCANHNTFSVEVPGGNYAMGPFLVKITLNSGSSATVVVTQVDYKEPYSTYSLNVAVALAGTDGPVGSLQGTIGSGNRLLSVGATFACSANGGGVYVGSTARTAGLAGQVDVYYTVSHDGKKIVEAIINTDECGGAWPNVQLMASNVPVASNGRFTVSGPLVAQDPSGVAFSGKNATFSGIINGDGSASGTMQLPLTKANQLNWIAAIAGPIAAPRFPHAPLSQAVVTDKQVASNPAINLIYPGSTNLDGSAPAAPAANYERPNEASANLHPWNCVNGVQRWPAEASREQVTPDSVYAVARWYQQKLLAFGWQTGTQPGGPNEITWFASAQSRITLHLTGRSTSSVKTDYWLQLSEVSSSAPSLEKGFTLGPMANPIVACIPTQAAAINVTGTVSGSTSTTCIPGIPACESPLSFNFAIGEVVFSVRLTSPLGTRNEVVVVGPHLDQHELFAVYPVSITSAGGNINVSGTFSGEGLLETLNASTHCGG